MADFIKRFYHKHGRLVRYLIVGGLTTLINLVVYWALTSGGSLYYQAANVVAWVVAVAFAFFANKWVVFRHHGGGIKKGTQEAVWFFLMRLLTLGFETLALYLLISVALWDSLPAKILVNIAVIVLNYVLSRLVVFRPAKRH